MSLLVVVLNDEETWTVLDGCVIRDIPDDWEDSKLPPKDASSIYVELSDWRLPQLPKS